MPLNPVIQAFLQAREQSDQQFRAMKDMELRQKMQEEQFKQQEKQLKQRLDFDRAVHDASLKQQQAQLKLQQATAKFSASQNIASSVAKGLLSPQQKGTGTFPTFSGDLELPLANRFYDIQEGDPAADLLGVGTKVGPLVFKPEADELEARSFGRRKALELEAAEPFNIAADEREFLKAKKIAEIVGGSRENVADTNAAAKLQAMEQGIQGKLDAIREQGFLRMALDLFKNQSEPTDLDIDSEGPNKNWANKLETGAVTIETLNKSVKDKKWINALTSSMISRNRIPVTDKMKKDISEVGMASQLYKEFEDLAKLIDAELLPQFTRVIPKSKVDSAIKGKTETINGLIGNLRLIAARAGAMSDLDVKHMEGLKPNRDLSRPFSNTQDNLEKLKALKGFLVGKYKNVLSGMSDEQIKKIVGPNDPVFGQPAQKQGTKLRLPNGRVIDVQEEP